MSLPGPSRRALDGSYRTTPAKLGCAVASWTIPQADIQRAQGGNIGQGELTRDMASLAPSRGAHANSIVVAQFDGGRVLQTDEPLNTGRLRTRARRWSTAIA